MLARAALLRVEAVSLRLVGSAGSKRALTAVAGSSSTQSGMPLMVPSLLAMRAQALLSNNISGPSSNTTTIGNTLPLADWLEEGVEQGKLWDIDGQTGDGA